MQIREEYFMNKTKLESLIDEMGVVIADDLLMPCEEADEVIIYE